MDYIACAPNTKQFMSVVTDNSTDIFLLECFPAAQILTLISLKSYIDKYFFTFELSTKELLEWKQSVFGREDPYRLWKCLMWLYTPMIPEL